MNEGGADLSGSRGEGKEMKAIRETNRPKRGKARTRLGWLRQLLDPFFRLAPSWLEQRNNQEPLQRQGLTINGSRCLGENRPNGDRCHWWWRPSFDEDDEVLTTLLMCFLDKRPMFRF